MSAARIRAEIVILARYGPRGASSRLRLYQFIPALEGAGFRVTRRPMFSDAYVAARYRNPAAALARAAAAYVRRLSQLAALPRDAVLWVEYELLPWLPYAVERRFFDGSRSVVVEYDDAIFHRYDRNASVAVRRWLGDKIDRIMRSATLVVAGNAYLAERARTAGARRVEIIPTVIDFSRYRRKEVFSPESFAVGWIGSGSTIRYLESLLPVLAAVRDVPGFGVVNVGGPPWHPAGVPVRNVPWTEDSEVDAMQSFDVGVMPLPDDPWTRGKCGYKLIQYMGCGLPVIASPVGVNTTIVEPGSNGFLASTPGDWISALRRLAADPSLRAAMGARGREVVARRYSVEAVAPIWLRVFEDLVQPARLT